MISLNLLIVFVGALAIVYALPGPDMALIVQTSTLRGAKHGLATAGGLAIARATHVTLSACGVAALLRDAPWLYQGVRIAGALYLAYLAIQIFRSPEFGVNADVQQRATVKQPAMQSIKPSQTQSIKQPIRSAVAKGMLSNILNPKALLFCSVLLPQFIEPHGLPVWSQVLQLGVLLVFTGVAFDLIYVFGAVRLSSWLRRHPRAQTVQRWSFSAALMAFALRLSIN